MNCCRQCAPQAGMGYYVRPPRVRVRRAMNYYDRGMGRSLRGGRGLRGLGDVAAIPAGSQLTYTVQYSNSWNPTNPSFWSNTIAGQIAAVKAALQAQNIALLNYSDNTGFGSSANLTLNVQTLGDFGAVADIKSVIDGAFYNAAGISVSSSTLSVSQLASPGSATALTPIGTPPAAAPFDLGTFLTNNWIYIAGAVLGAVVVEDLL